MRNAPALLALAPLSPIAVVAQPQTETDMPPIAYPGTAEIPVVEEHFGHTIADPYRWLENDIRTDDQVCQWVAAQNALTEDHLATLPGRAIFAERMASLLNFEQVTAPIKRGERYFYTRNSGQENQSVLYVRDGVEGAPQALIDPNAIARACRSTASSPCMPTNGPSRPIGLG